MDCYRFGTGSNKLSISVMVWSSTEVAVGGEKNAKPNKAAFNSVLFPPLVKRAHRLS